MSPRQLIHHAQRAAHIAHLRALFRLYPRGDIIGVGKWSGHANLATFTIASIRSLYTAGNAYVSTDTIFYDPAGITSGENHIPFDNQPLTYTSCNNGHNPASPKKPRLPFPLNPSIEDIPARSVSLQERIEKFQDWLEEYIPPATEKEGDDTVTVRTIQRHRARIDLGLNLVPSSSHFGHVAPKSAGATISAFQIPHSQPTAILGSTSRRPCPSRTQSLRAKRPISAIHPPGPGTPRKALGSINSILSDTGHIQHSVRTAPVRPKRATGRGLFEVGPIWEYKKETKWMRRLYGGEEYWICEEPPTPAMYRDGGKCPEQPLRYSEDPSLTLTPPDIPRKSSRRDPGVPIVYWTITGAPIIGGMPWVPGGYI